MNPITAVENFLSGETYRDMKATQTRIMELSAAASGKSAEAFQQTQAARDKFNEAKALYNRIAGQVNIQCATYGCGRVNMLAGLGLPQAVIAPLIAAGIAASIILLYQMLSTAKVALDKAAAILDKMGILAEKSSDAFMKVALVAGVGFGAYMLWDSQKRRRA